MLLMFCAVSVYVHVRLLYTLHVTICILAMRTDTATWQRMSGLRVIIFELQASRSDVHIIALQILVEPQLQLLRRASSEPPSKGRSGCRGRNT